MIDLSPAPMKRLTAVHGWSGVILGLFLYVVVVTGTLVVFAHELETWSIGGIRHEEPLSGPIDDKVRPLIDIMSKGYQRDINLFSNAKGDLFVYPHAELRHPETGETESYGALFQVDPESGEVLSRRDGFVFHDTNWYVESALEDFLVGLHVRLYVPEPWGYILTGVLGLLMISTGISGLLMHRHMIRDAFVAVRPGARLVTFRDRHVLAGTWGLAFTFLLGFTGAYFSFAGTVIFPLLTEVAFGGDEDRAVETLFVPQRAEDARPAPLANLDAILADAQARVGTPPSSVGIQNYGRADALVRVFHPPPPGHLEFVQPVYDGVSGAFLYFRPNIGREASSGSVLRGLMWPLHAGDFAGVASKALWVGLGSAMAYVVVSGLHLWVRRRSSDPSWRRFGRVVMVSSHALPVALLACAHAYYLALVAGGDPNGWTPAGFLLGFIPGIVPGWRIVDEVEVRRTYRRLLGGGLLLLPVLRMAAGGLSWAESIAQGQGTVLSVDLGLMVLGGGLLWWARRLGSGMVGSTSREGGRT
jgi:uncharacterized iron-regulated membrane protein